MASFTTKNNASEKPIGHEQLKPAKRRQTPTPQQTRKAPLEAALPARAAAQWAAVSVGAAVTPRRPMAPSTHRRETYPLATMTMWSRDNCAKPPCERQILRFAKSCGMSIANTKA